MSAKSVHRFATVVLLTIFMVFFAHQPVNGFLFTPKFQIYLNTLRGTNHEFVIKWDTLTSNPNAVGFSYATNQNGKFDFEILFLTIW